MDHLINLKLIMDKLANMFATKMTPFWDLMTAASMVDITALAREPESADEKFIEQVTISKLNINSMNIDTFTSCTRLGKSTKVTKELHNKYWTEVSGCRQSKQALPNIDRRLSRVTDSPLCRACLEAEETAAHIVLECTGVTNYRAKHLGSPRTLPEVIGDTRGLINFLEELGWQN